MTDPRFPIGKFHFDGPLSEDQRTTFIADIAETPAAPSRRGERFIAAAARHSLPRRWLDGPPGHPSRPRQPHECLRSIQAGAHRRRPDHQALRRGSMGATRRHGINAHRGFASAARFAAHPLGTIIAFAKARGLEADFQTSGARTGVAGDESCSLRLAWKASRRPRHRAEKTNGLVKKPNAPRRHGGTEKSKPRICTDSHGSQKRKINEALSVSIRVNPWPEVAFVFLRASVSPW